ncbi:MAG: hypothetical protein JOZ08_08325 [Verrucomicrobia bacterium]|nr:hypothetical protein [Verrucomicrobiota bacterium]
MYKRLLSQALDHGAFPLVVLAVAVSQVNTNRHTEPALLIQGRESLEVGQSAAMERNLGESRLSMPRRNPPFTERSSLNKEANQNR